MRDADAHIIKIDSIVLSGSPGHAAIEAAVARALGEAGMPTALGASRTDASAQEVTRSIVGAVRGGGG